MRDREDTKEKLESERDEIWYIDSAWKRKRALEREKREREERGNENCEIHAFKVLFKEEQFDSTQNYINFNLRYSWHSFKRETRPLLKGWTTHTMSLSQQQQQISVNKGFS